LFYFKLLGHRVWSTKGERSIIINSEPLTKSFSLTALMSLDESHPVILDLREQSNTQVISKNFVVIISSMTSFALLPIFWNVTIWSPETTFFWILLGYMGQTPHGILFLDFSILRTSDWFGFPHILRNSIRWNFFGDF
jgi:hypothetical protein